MNLKPFIASTAAAAVVAGGALASSTVALFSPAEDEAIALVPATAFAYGNIFLEPSVDQKLALKDLLANFPEASTPEAATDAIAELLDQGLSEIGLSFAADIEPWLGTQIAFFFTPPTMGAPPGGAVLVASDDPGATQATLENAATASPEPLTSASYNGIDYFTSADGGDAVGVIEDFMVLGTEADFRAVADTGAGGSLGDSGAYNDAFDGLTEDRLATFYVDPRNMLAGMAGMAAPGMLQGGLGMGAGATGAALFVRGDSIVVETGSPLPADGAQRALFADLAAGTDLIERLPARAWGAFATPRFGEMLSLTLTQVAATAPGMSPEVIAEGFQAQTGLDLDQLLGWIGDVAVFVEGSAPDALAGGAVIRSTDPGASADAMDPIADALATNGVPVEPLGLGSFEGFRIQDRSMPEGIHVIAADERVVIVYGREAALAALGSDPNLGSTEGFTAATAALGDGFAVSGYADIGAVVRVVEGALGTGGEDALYDARVRTFLDPLSFFVVGSKVEGDRTMARLVIGVR